MSTPQPANLSGQPIIPTVAHTPRAATKPEKSAVLEALFEKFTNFRFHENERKSAVLDEILAEVDSFESGLQVLHTMNFEWLNPDFQLRLLQHVSRYTTQTNELAELHRLMTLARGSENEIANLKSDVHDRWLTSKAADTLVGIEDCDFAETYLRFRSLNWDQKQYVSAKKRLLLTLCDKATTVDQILKLLLEVEHSMSGAEGQEALLLDKLNAVVSELCSRISSLTEVRELHSRMPQNSCAELVVLKKIVELHPC